MTATAPNRSAIPMPFDDKPPATPFWRRKTLEELSPEEWESLCDGCGRCCLVKLEEEETEKTHFTDVACFMLDCRSGQCSDYASRPAPTASSPTVKSFTGGIRWCRAIPPRSTPPASPSAAR